MARGLNTIASRITKNEKALAQYGIAIKDSSGELRSTYDVLSDLAKQWGTMSDAEKTALGNSLAGVRQYPILSAVLQNFNTAIDATATAYNSAGSAERENEKYLDSLAGRTELLKAQFQELVLAKGGLGDFAKSLLTLTTNILKLINSTGGLPTLLTTVLGLLILIKREAIAGAITDMVQSVKNLGVALLQQLAPALKTIILGMNQHGVATRVATEATTGFALSLNSVIGGIGLVITAISLITMAYKKYQQSQEEARQSAIDSLNEYVNESKRVEELESAIQSNKLSEEQLGQIISNNTDIFGAYSDSIENSTDKLQESLNVLKKYNAEQANEYIQENISEIKKAVDELNRVSVGYIKTGRQILPTDTLGISSTEKKALEGASQKYLGASNLKEEIDGLRELQDAYNSLNDESGKFDYQISIISKRIKELEKDQDSNLTILGKSKIAFENAGDSASAYSGVYKSVSDVLENYSNELSNTGNEIKNIADSEDDLNDLLDEQKSELEDLEKVFSIVTQKLDDEIDAIKKQKEAYDKSIKAQIDKLNAKKDKIQANIDALKEENSVLSEQSSKYQKVFSIVIDRVNNDIDKLNDKLDKSNDYYDNLYDSTEKYYDKLIDKLKESNDEQNRTVELAEKLEALEKAKSQRVMTFDEKTGQWGWGINQQAVADAQKALDEYQRQQTYDNKLIALEEEKRLALEKVTQEQEKQTQIIQKQIDNLKQYVEQVTALQNKYEETSNTKLIREYLNNGDIYDINGLKKVEKQYEKTENKIKSNEKAISRLEDKQKTLQEQIKETQKVQEAQDKEYDNQIEKITTYKNKVDKLAKSYEDAFNEELLDNYDIKMSDIIDGNITRLNDLADAYYNLQVQIAELDTQINSLNSNPTPVYWVKNPNGSYTSQTQKPSNGQSYMVEYITGQRASGDSSIENDGVYLVGDSPNEELVIGNRINKTGSLMNLAKGVGVVNAKSTQTLAGLLNTLGGIPSGTTLNNNLPNGSSTILNIDKVSVEANDAQSFIDSMRSFAIQMKQKAY